MRVGLIGLGYMGARFGHRLAGRVESLAVYDVDRARGAELAAKGAKMASDPAAVGASSDLVFLCLSDLAAIRAVVGSDHGGLLSSMVDGSTIVDLSTSSHSLTLELAQIANAKGVAFVDCPVSGGAAAIDDGILTLLAGGEPKVIARCRPVLDVLGRVFYMGPTGSGTAAKLVTQQIGYVAVLAALEALVSAEAAGLDRAALVEVLPVSAAREVVTTRHLEQISQRAFGNPAVARASAPVYIIEKDLALALQLGTEFGTPTTFVRAAVDLLRKALGKGWSDYSFLRSIEILEGR